MFVALDLETTGLTPEKDQIIEVAAVRLSEDGTIQEEFQTLVNPGVALPEIIRHLTGLTDEDLKDAPPIDEVRDQIIDFIGDSPILGHSVQFDVDFLAANEIPVKGTILDTFHLSQTLLEREPSYSLEILSEKFNLTHESKHRALDDTKVAIELYKLLLKKIKEIPSEAAEQIRDVLNKSDFGWEETFLKNLPQKNNAAKNTPAKKDPQPQAGAQPELQEAIIAALSKGESTIFETPLGETSDLAIAATNFTENSGEKCLLVTPEPQNIERDARIAQLQHPARYLCQARLKQFLKSDHFDTGETRLLIKIFLWLARGGSGEKNEIIIGDDEQSAWDQISALPHLYESCDDPDCFYNAALKNAKLAHLLVVSQRLYIDNLTRQGTLIPQKPHHLIESIEIFEETALRSLTKYYALNNLQNFAKTVDESLTSRFEIFFGLLGMFLDKHAPKDAFQKQTIIGPEHFQTPEFKKVKDTLLSLEEEIETLPASPNQRLLKKDLSIIQKAFAGNPHVLTWIMLNYEGTPAIRTCPAQMGPLLKQELWDKIEGSKIFLSNYGSLEGNFSFIKNQLQLPVDIPEIFLKSENNRTLDLVTHPEFPNTRAPKNLFDTFEFLKKESPKQTAFLLCNSISAVSSLHEKLADPLKKAEVLLLSQSISGGMGKISQRFLKAEDTTLIIGTERLYTHLLKNNPEAAQKIQTLFIHRLPFIPPSHPVHQKVCEGLQNSWYEYSLPQAVLRMKRFLYWAITKTQASTVHVLDPRFEDYDGKFTKSVKNVWQTS